MPNEFRITGSTKMATASVRLAVDGRVALAILIATAAIAVATVTTALIADSGPTATRRIGRWVLASTRRIDRLIRI
jgi:hypothetical protein